MDAQAKQQIVERVKQANNVLVTVSNNPSVDQLAACIGLTLLLNKMQKHGTAVFSGKVPSTIEFLQPEKTIQANTDSLRDFIISLDKAKADKLRYKVEDQVVRIFITPYRTSLSEKDLQFSQGDINVEAVIALGVHNRTQVDAAITQHGRILHDATIISLNAGQGKPADVGQINWQDPTASSLCEMLVSISEAFGPNLIDSQTATALLTGIVAETKRFSDPKTSPKTMTMAAQLMAAGANQQLIVAKLEPPKPAAPPKPPTPPAAPPAPRQPKPEPPKPPEPKKPADGTLNVSHDKDKKDSGEVEIVPGEIHIDDKGNLKTAEELEKDAKQQKKDMGMTTLAPEVSAEEPEPQPEPIQPITPVPAPPEPQPPTPAPQPEAPPAPQQPPLGPTAMPADGGMTQPIVVAPEAPKPHELLGAGYKPTFNAPFTADTETTEWVDPYNSVPIDPTASGANGTVPPPQPHTATMPHERVVQPPPTINNARDAVQNAIAGSDFAPPAPIAALNAMPVGPELHNTGAPTPALQLPSNGLVAPGAAPDIAPPAPPSVPPPLPMAQNMVAPTNGQVPAQPLF